MATLLIKTEGLENQVLELRPGVNRVGRSPDSDFVINHGTVSTNHCEFILSADGVFLRDCDSTNGSSVNGSPIKEARLLAGQTVGLGDVELFVESTEANVVIPEYERPRPKPPVVLPTGAMICPRHTQAEAKYKCTHCREIMCGECVHVLRRKGGSPLFLCPLCSHKCELIQIVTAKKKKSFVEFLEDTVKLRFRDTVTGKKPKK
ncbi:MAG TPA: FHA domain-containing protein [Candidatus Acidoferrales bacterium]|jgi:pSer/pThr/pTyr-binding forkhead associated (FHA) protein|nr:FHA domain-containing protein [Candidatus Acidoferrales bacterium]